MCDFGTTFISSHFIPLSFYVCLKVSRVGFSTSFIYLRVKGKYKRHFYAHFMNAIVELDLYNLIYISFAFVDKTNV